MATHAPITGAPAGVPFNSTLAAELLAGLRALQRQQIEALAEAAIAVLDEIDGDADEEADGDEEDGNGAEDDECAWFERMGDGPGDEISDGGRPDYYDGQVRLRYGVDQTTGPINIDEVLADFRRLDDERSFRDYERL